MQLFTVDEFAGSGRSAPLAMLTVAIIPLRIRAGLQ